MRKKVNTYEDAMNRLNELVEQVENNELSIDKLAENLKEAKMLIEFCRKKLYETDEEIQKVLSDKEK